MDCKSFYAGETLDFRFNFPAYPASDGWSGKAVLTCASVRQSVELGATGDELTASVPAATTADWSPGVYVLNVIVTHSDGRSYVAHESELAVRQNPGAETPSLSAFEQQLVKIDEAITAIAAGQGVQSYAITTAAGTRQIQRMSLDDLRKHRLWLEGKIDAERVAFGQKPKTKPWKSIGVAFRS